jgi:hypothetical protein
MHQLLGHGTFEVLNVEGNTDGLGTGRSFASIPCRFLAETPPQIPSRSLFARAHLRHSSRTGHSSQIAAASTPPAPVGYHISGSRPRHSAERRHPCASDRTRRIAGVSSVAKADLIITPSIRWRRRSLGRRTMIFTRRRDHRAFTLLQVCIRRCRLGVRNWSRRVTN